MCIFLPFLLPSRFSPDAGVRRYLQPGSHLARSCASKLCKPLAIVSHSNLGNHQLPTDTIIESPKQSCYILHRFPTLHRIKKNNFFLHSSPHDKKTTIMKIAEADWSSMHCCRPKQVGGLVSEILWLGSEYVPIKKNNNTLRFVSIFCQIMGKDQKRSSLRCGLFLAELRCGPTIIND